MLVSFGLTPVTVMRPHPPLVLWIPAFAGMTEGTIHLVRRLFRLISFHQPDSPGDEVDKSRHDEYLLEPCEVLLVILAAGSIDPYRQYQTECKRSYRHDGTNPEYRVGLSGLFGPFGQSNGGLLRFID